MRALDLSLVLAFAVLVSSGSMAGSPTGPALHAGLFAYAGSPFVAARPIVVRTASNR